MDSCLVYDQSKLDWVSVEIPFTHIQTWSKADSFFYARAYLTATQKGFQEKTARSLAEVAVFKRLFPGVIYGKQIETQYKSLFTD